MLSDFSEDNPFASIDPKDGYHVVQVTQAGEISLHCEFFSGGSLFALPCRDGAETSLLIEDWPKPLAAEHGECRRLYLVLDAVARYLTTGGSFVDLDNALTTFKEMAIGQIVYPGYYYADGYVCPDGVYQHVFIKAGTSEAVIWEEPALSEDRGTAIGGWISPTTLEAIEAAEANDAEQAQEGFAGPADLA